MHAPSLCQRFLLQTVLGARFVQSATPLQALPRTRSVGSNTSDSAVASAPGPEGMEPAAHGATNTTEELSPAGKDNWELLERIVAAFLITPAVANVALLANVLDHLLDSETLDSRAVRQGMARNPSARCPSPPALAAGVCRHCRPSG